MVVKAVIGSIAQICGGKWVRCKNKPQTSSTRGTCCNISTVFDVITCFFEKPNIEEQHSENAGGLHPVHCSAAPTNEPARALYLHSSNHMRAVCTTEGALGVRGGPRLDYSRGVRWAPITHAKPHSTQTHPTSPSLHCYQPNSPLKGKCLQIIQHHSHASGAQQMGEHRG